MIFVVEHQGLSFYFSNNCNLVFKTENEIFQLKSERIATKNLKSLELYTNESNPVLITDWDEEGSDAQYEEDDRL